MADVFDLAGLALGQRLEVELYVQASLPDQDQTLWEITGERGSVFRLA